MKNVLITGIEGFVGSHLALTLLGKIKDISITGTYLLEPDREKLKNVNFIKVDIKSKEEISELFRKEKSFDAIFHLAGLANVGYSWKHPEEVMEVNILGTLHFLEEIRKTKEKAKFLFVSSSDIYNEKSSSILDESASLNPESPYAISKLAAENLVTTYGKAYDIPVYIARPVPHTGPGQSTSFAVMDFCSQAVKLKKDGLSSPAINVGNIDVAKDYCDVRDVVDAYIKIMECSKAGEIYNISTGVKITLREIVEKIKRVLSFNFELKQDPSRLRPHDPDIVVLENLKLKALGWKPRYSIEDTIKDIIDDIDV
ncbi:MAG: GDP-mannose 4,6-dehydratase [Candidatus Aureabacteria bacterium]|nr:GDP-mannose 4,6-dehydratase [Candidatus Auribacterota bacterium]